MRAIDCFPNHHVELRDVPLLRVLYRYHEGIRRGHRDSNIGVSVIISSMREPQQYDKCASLAVDEAVPHIYTGGTNAVCKD